MRNTVSCLFVTLGCLASCASLPPGAQYPKHTSEALAHPEATRLGGQFADQAAQSSGKSGFRIISVGADGFLMRMQMINAAERTLDLQYYIFHGDETGRLLTGAVLHAADRGVRVRILIDDGETLPGDEQLTALESHPSVELRIFNPFAYRGHSMAIRALEFAWHGRRLDYRMHNKLIVVDNAMALIGGRNIGDQYFQIDADSQFADDDMFCAGPIVPQLSATFDDFWRSPLAIPAEALGDGKTTRADLREHRQDLNTEAAELTAAGNIYVKRVAGGEPFQGVLSGRLPLTWAAATLVYDSPEKKRVDDGTTDGSLMHHQVMDAARSVKSELLMITPYLIPGEAGMALLTGLRQNQVRVRVLTNSLESSTELLAQSGYMRYRLPMLESGMELYEIRSLLGNVKGSGESVAMSRYGNYSLHAKLLVFDRQRIFIGSMNFDQRSEHLNTEIGLIIDSPVLAAQVAQRFDAMVQSANAYALVLRQSEPGSAPSIHWRTAVGPEPVEYASEPARSRWQRFLAQFLSYLPMDREL